MKKLCYLSFFFILLATAVYAQAPAPFEKAKELALKATPDARGNYYLTFQIQEASFFILGYLPADSIIGVGKVVGQKLIVAEYSESTKKFFFWVNGVRVETSEMAATSFAFEVFRELVANNLV